MQGTMIWFNPAKKHGFIRTDDGERLRVDLDQPITTDHVNLVQPLVSPNQRYITKVELSFDGGDIGRSHGFVEISLIRKIGEGVGPLQQRDFG